MTVLAPAFVSVDEYLRTTYRPDCDYIGGALEERNLGQREHSAAQRAVVIWFWIHRRELRLKAYPEQRMAVGPGRYRVPDICVVTLPGPAESIFTDPPFLTIEILSPGDTLPKLQERVDDYLAMGVPNLWAIDPVSRRGWRVTVAGYFEALDGVLRTADGSVAMPLQEVFALDEE